MCRQQPVQMSAPAPIQKRNPDLTASSKLPGKKELVDPEDVAGVEYGSTAKPDPKVAAKRMGTDALKINLNTGAGAEASGGTGGVNV